MKTLISVLFISFALGACTSKPTSETRQPSSARFQIRDVVAPNTTYQCQEGVTMSISSKMEISMRAPENPALDRELAKGSHEVTHTFFAESGFLVPYGDDPSKDANFVAAIMQADPGGAWNVGAIYAVSRGKFRIGWTHGSSLPEGICREILP